MTTSRFEPDVFSDFDAHDRPMPGEWVRVKNVPSDPKARVARASAPIARPSGPAGHSTGVPAKPKAQKRASIPWIIAGSLAVIAAGSVIAIGLTGHSTPSRESTERSASKNKFVSSTSVADGSAKPKIFAKITDSQNHRLQNGDVVKPNQALHITVNVDTAGTVVSGVGDGDVKVLSLDQPDRFSFKPEPNFTTVSSTRVSISARVTAPTLEENNNSPRFQLKIHVNAQYAAEGGPAHPLTLDTGWNLKLPAPPAPPPLIEPRIKSTARSLRDRNSRPNHPADHETDPVPSPVKNAEGSPSKKTKPSGYDIGN